jgi:hypothetical protein
MVSSRIRSWAPAALLLTLLLALGTVMSPAQAVIKRSLSIHASATVVGAGTSVTFSGTLTNTPTGGSVHLQVKIGTYWVTARSTTTSNSAGAYRVSVPMSKYVGKNYYRAMASRTSTRSSAVSTTIAVTTLKRVYASLKPDRTSVSPGQLVTFTGHVNPCVVGSTVKLQRWAGSGWTTLTYGALNSNCNIVRVVRELSTTSYRLAVPRHGDLAPAYSAVVKITYKGPVSPPPTITTTSLPAGDVGTFYSQTLTKTGQPGTWSRTSGSLPGGLSLSSSTGKISGTPTTGGTFSFTVRYTESSPYSGTVSKALSIKVNTGPVVTTSSLPDGKRGVAYSTTLTKTGAAGTWSALHLPSGVTLDPNTGAISGTPVVEGDFTVAVTFTETTSGKKAYASLPLHIATSPPPVITTTTLPDGVKNSASPYSATLQETSDSGLSGVWSVTQGALPPGITLDASTGALSGTPTASDDYQFTVTFTETAAQTSDSQALVLHVSPAANSPVITTTTLPNGTVGVAYSATVAGNSLGTWSITKFAPNWLSINGLSGQLTGTPSQPGDYTFQVTYSAVNGTQTKLFTIHVDPAP